MTIKEFSKRTDLPISTVRYYDKLGLFPGLERDSSGYRKFTENDIDWALFVRRLKDTGMDINGIVNFISLIDKGDNTIPDRLSILEIHRDELKKRIERDNFHLKKLNEKIETYQKSLALK